LKQTTEIFTIELLFRQKRRRKRIRAAEGETENSERTAQFSAPSGTTAESRRKYTDSCSKSEEAE